MGRKLIGTITRYHTIQFVASTLFESINSREAESSVLLAQLNYYEQSVDGYCWNRYQLHTIPMCDSEAHTANWTPQILVYNNISDLG